MVLRAHRLREHIVHTSRFQDRANAAASDQTGTGGSRAKEHFAAVIFAEHFVWDRAALELNGNHALLGRLGGFLDGVRYFVGLAVADANVALAVTHDGKSGETETTTALHNLGAAIDENYFLKHAGLSRIIVVRARTG